ncbi:hypothetical protein HUB98_04280 [Paenibacillus barcinonensis]|uniref:Uncharacterized protein n=1 Tax=Paenibacillus barcinonensis TaxID=198119 RepID=A0A2V4UT39_PAEBA|nr:hypothetical protein [Paenibacillus barcinonensis]PYE43253.1 hypothetical protein DFQ00_12913 [Paenibacillus barcinonensis]QKS55613.1 hypothetical protein HUB98_04280 [Paenibacillus barcinonensis]
MFEGMKVEFEISAWGHALSQDAGDFFQKHEMLRIRILPKETDGNLTYLG